MDSTSLLEKPSVVQQDGKYLVFLLGGNNYGVPILDVSEINGIMEITPMPKFPDYIKGVINLRGKVIPVMDLRLKLDMPQKDYDVETCIIIISATANDLNNQVGIIVDTVSEVFDIPLSDIDNPPSQGSMENNNFLSGIGKIKGKIVMLLDIQKIVSCKEINTLIAG